MIHFIKSFITFDLLHNFSVYCSEMCWANPLGSRVTSDQTNSNYGSCHTDSGHVSCQYQLTWIEDWIESKLLSQGSDRFTIRIRSFRPKLLRKLFQRKESEDLLLDLHVFNTVVLMLNKILTVPPCVFVTFANENSFKSAH